MGILPANIQFDWSAGLGWVAGRLALIVVLYIALRLVRRAVRKAIPRVVKPAILRRSRGDDAEEVAKRYRTVSSVAVKTVEAAIWLTFAAMILSLLGQDIKPLLAGMGIAGIAIGFGAQTVVKDIISGLFILLENQYGKGDVVELAGMSGSVEEVNLRRTVLRDLDGTVHNIPNGEVRVASNRTRDWSGLNLNVRVSYDEDLDRVFALINGVGADLAADPDLAPFVVEPPRALRVEGFEELGITIKVTGLTRPGRQWAVAGELRKRLKNAFDDAGVEMSRAHRLPFKSLR